ncbi:BnaCnng27930D [Brassica napus]|uniref:BnaCnng27930D protein n=1 Tax=Brassica napus TaxID=3708 RepID=A0A078IUE1_BRANA|nr:BnaCnng27930D [Brassica napus]
MVDECENGDGATAARSYSHQDHKTKEAGDSSDSVDSISFLPDVILQSILSSLPTEIAIKTSILSKRWRHVWSDTPCLSFDWIRPHGPKGDIINKILGRYKARKMISFKLNANLQDDIPYIDRWIEFAMSRNVENMSLVFGYDGDHKYHVPDSFYISNSFKQLKCMDKILSGCPVLESLTLDFCDKLLVLDLSKYLRLRTLVIKQARMEICFCALEDLEADFLQTMVLRMLEKLQHVDKLTFGENFLTVLTLAELRRVPIPRFKVKDLTLETMISQYVIPGIVRVLQNSPELEKLTTIHRMKFGTITKNKIDTYLDLQGVKKDQRWSLEARVFENLKHWDVESRHVASFMELMFTKTKTLEKMVVWFYSYRKGQTLEELPEMVPVLADKNNVSIVLHLFKPDHRV